jgi:hypothetical protein
LSIEGKTHQESVDPFGGCPPASGGRGCATKPSSSDTANPTRTFPRSTAATRIPQPQRSSTDARRTRCRLPSPRARGRARPQPRPGRQA